MSSGPTPVTWPIDGPPVAPSITFMDLPTGTLPAATVPIIPIVPTVPVVPTTQSELEAALQAAALVQPPPTG